MKSEGVGYTLLCKICNNPLLKNEVFQCDNVSCGQLFCVRCSDEQLSIIHCGRCFSNICICCSTDVVEDAELVDANIIIGEKRKHLCKACFKEKWGV